jgi:hypothetical protein
VKALRSLLLGSVLALALASTTARSAESPYKFEFHGFVVGSLYLQNQTFLTGQGSGLLMAAPTPGNHVPRPGVATDKEGTFLGGDIRQLRPIFVISGPDAFGAKAKAHFEFDLFGNANAGALGYESPNVRLRQAFGELKWGNTSLDAGQHSAQLLLAMIPTSVAHITNPVTFGAGLIGWRTIGFRVLHAVPDIFEGWKLELGAELSHGKWNDAAAGVAMPGNTPQTISLAWAPSTPQVVGRLKLDGKAGGVTTMVWVAGSFEAVDLKGFGSTVAPNGITLQDPDGAGPQTGANKKTLSSWAATAGGKFDCPAATCGLQLSLALQGYTGRGTAPIAGTTLQFGDIADLGYWAQLGVWIDPRLSIWGIVGSSSADKKDLQSWLNLAGTDLSVPGTTIRKDNNMYGGMLRYMDGGYAYAVEYFAYDTMYLTGNLANGGATKGSSAYQVLLSGGYFF